MLTQSPSPTQRQTNSASNLHLLWQKMGTAQLLEVSTTLAHPITTWCTTTSNNNAAAALPLLGIRVARGRVVPVQQLALHTAQLLLHQPGQPRNT